MKQTLNPTVEAIINRNSKYRGKMREEGHENHRYKVTKKRRHNYVIEEGKPTIPSVNYKNLKLPPSHKPRNDQVLPASKASYAYPSFSSKTLQGCCDTSLPYIHKSKFEPVAKYTSNRNSRTSEKGPNSLSKSE